MIHLVDTNVLIRLVDRSSSKHAVARAAARTLHADGHALHAAPQNFAEHWNVTTRPQTQNGLGLSTADADRSLRVVERVCPLLPDLPAAYPEWRRLVTTYAVSGVQTHDARLVALMLVYGVKRILTFDTGDFARFVPEGIIAVDPASV